MNGIFVGAKVIYQNEVWIVEDLPCWCKAWRVRIMQGHTHTFVPLDDIIMPEGLNDNNHPRGEK